MNYFISTIVSAILALVYTVLIFLVVLFAGFALLLVIYVIIFTVIFLFTALVLSLIIMAGTNNTKQRH